MTPVQHHNRHRSGFIFDLGNVQSSVLQVLQSFRPDRIDRMLQDDLVIKHVGGGVTNTLFCAFFGNNNTDKTLIRVYGEGTENIVDRDLEVRIMSELHEVDCCGQIYGLFENGMCYEYVEGEALTPETVAEPRIRLRLIEKLVQLHSIRGFDTSDQNLPEVNLFTKMRKMLGQVSLPYPEVNQQQRFDKSFPSGLESIYQEINEMEALLENVAKTNPPVIGLCHNDLTPGNILFNKATDLLVKLLQRYSHEFPPDDIRFIDFEYADINYQAFDIANHFNEYADTLGVEECDYNRCPDAGYQNTWIREYLECWKRLHACDQPSYSNGLFEVSNEEVESLVKLVSVFMAFSHLFWTPWSLYLAGHSNIDFDYLEYGCIRYQEYQKQKKKIKHERVLSY